MNERAQGAGWPVAATLETEVLVIGSGVSGVCVAIQAARSGCRTVLIEKDEVLGGNSGPNLGVHVSGAHSYHPYAAETGVMGELEEEAARDFPDNAAFGGYSIDVHEPVGTRSKVVCYSVPPLYSIPYRCLYSKDLDNVFLAGRLVSVTHLALGTVRLTKTGGVIEHAIGVAAGIGKRRRPLRLAARARPARLLPAQRGGSPSPGPLPGPPLQARDEVEGRGLVSKILLGA